MSIRLEIRIGNGQDKPKVAKQADGTWIVMGTLPQACVAHSRAVWVKSYELGDPQARDGKGFLIGPAGTLTKG